MDPLVHEVELNATPEELAAHVAGEEGAVLLRSALFQSKSERYSFLAAHPFWIFTTRGSHSVLREFDGDYPSPRAFERATSLYGNPWSILEELIGRCEIVGGREYPFPLGGCFGFWGYDLKRFVEPKVTSRAANNLLLPECWVGFHGSLVVFDHQLQKRWVVATGLGADGVRSPKRAEAQLNYWKGRIDAANRQTEQPDPNLWREPGGEDALLTVPMSPENFCARVRRALDYIRQGDIYQVNLSHRMAAATGRHGWQVYQRLLQSSPAPFSAYLHCGSFQLASSSPELFLSMSGSEVVTRPIKGTRPRHSDPQRDAEMTMDLKSSPKEKAELVMITDLLRNDLGRFCEYGSVKVPELARIERFPQVQHLVSTVTGTLRPEFTHLGALASSFPGGSITGAPKLRAMQIIDELEDVARGPYSGALGYIGFNRESQLSIAIRTAVCRRGNAWFHVGAGIVADSMPEAEYEETMAKAAGFRSALAGMSAPAGRGFPVPVDLKPPQNIFKLR